MKRDMRTKADKAIARELRLHGDITSLRLKLADREKRIKLARRELYSMRIELDALDLRKPLRPARRGR